MWVRKQQLEMDMEQQTGSKLGRDAIRLYIVTLFIKLICRVQAGIRIAKRNINSLRYATTLMAESEEELKSLLMRTKDESEKAGLKLNIKKKKNRIVIPSPVTSWQIEGRKVQPVTDFIFLGSQLTADGDYSHEIKKTLLPWLESYDKQKQRHHFADKGAYSQSYDFFPVVIYACENLDHKEG